MGSRKHLSLQKLFEKIIDKHSAKIISDPVQYREYELLLSARRYRDPIQYRSSYLNVLVFLCKYFDPLSVNLLNSGHTDGVK